PIGQAARGTRRRTQEGGLAARAIRIPRCAARGRTLSPEPGGLAALPANSDSRRLCPTPSPLRSIPNVGGGVLPPSQLGPEPISRPPRGPHRLDVGADQPCRHGSAHPQGRPSLAPGAVCVPSTAPPKVRTHP